MSFERTSRDFWGTRLGECSVPEGASFYCLRPENAEFRRSNATSLRTGQKGRSESEKGHFSMTTN